ncbi:MAG: hypothetical protein K0R54_731 [Clostridiaceae bacterium]|jgi:hypothetical protein|nr:hypothetical protein [Clostridiaceae bacterium]
MKNSKFKVRIKDGKEKYFEELCNNNNVNYKRYPAPLTSLYRIECKESFLKKANMFVDSIDNMPIITLQ